MNTEITTFRRLVEALQASYADVAARAAEYEGENSFRGGFFVGKHAAYREILELLNSLQESRREEVQTE